MAHDHRIGLRQPFNASSNIGHVSQGQLFLSTFSSHLANHNQTSMYSKTHRQSDALVVFDVVIQCLHRIEDLQASPYCSLGIILMGLGVAKVDEESIAQELRNMTVIALDDL